MGWEIDHVFLAMDAAADFAPRLTSLGAELSSGRVHVGQGTKNLSAHFANAYLELLLPNDEDELRSDLVRPLGLHERIHWRQSGACPVGLCFRPADADADPNRWPFTTWMYEPPYVAAGAGIPIVTPARSLAEPLVFVSPWPRATQRDQASDRRTMTGVTVSCPTSEERTSAGLAWFVRNGLVSLRTGPTHLEIELDAGGTGGGHREESVPLSFRW